MLTDSVVLQVRQGGKRVYLDESLECSNWLKYIRTTNQAEAQNVRAFLLAGQVSHKPITDLNSEL